MQRVYLHYPFCTRLCRYCNFTAGVSPDSNRKNAYHNALMRQINHYKHFNQANESFYLGGGTPSLMPADHMKEILDSFDISPNSEITLEINPETVTKELAAEWRRLGINRVSLGWQSMNEDILRFIGRTSTADDNIRAFNILRDEGFDNISVDRILSINGDSDELFLEAVDKVANPSSGQWWNYSTSQLAPAPSSIKNVPCFSVNVISFTD